MATYKVTFLFNQSRLGWTETHYTTTSTLLQAQNATFALATKRATLLGQGTIIEAWRISDVDKPRQCSLFTAPALSANEDPTDTAWNGILIEVCAGNREYHRNLIIRGVPDRWINWDPTAGQMMVNNVAQQRHTGFCNQLKLGWQLRVISKDAPDVNQLPTGALGENGDGFVTIIIAGTTAKAGETIRLSGYTGDDAKILNRVHKVLKVEANVVTIDVRSAALLNPASDTGGKALHHKIVYRPITDCEMLRPVKRSTGRAFFVPRGRRRVL